MQIIIRLLIRYKKIKVLINYVLNNSMSNCKISNVIQFIEKPIC